MTTTWMGMSVRRSLGIKASEEVAGCVCRQKTVQVDQVSCTAPGCKMVTLDGRPRPMFMADQLPSSFCNAGFFIGQSKVQADDALLDLFSVHKGPHMQKECACRRTSLLHYSIRWIDLNKAQAVYVRHAHPCQLQIWQRRSCGFRTLLMAPGANLTVFRSAAPHLQWALLAQPPWRRCHRGALRECMC
eukprot:1161926-Pelagomonas_calceolata.AAC.5